MRPGLRARLLTMIRARIMVGVAEHFGYDLTDDSDRLYAEEATDTIMAALFPRRAASTPPK